ncbi:MAG: polysaccharide pyruvyl transferase family protein, partial [Clostridia bacterium]
VYDREKESVITFSDTEKGKEELEISKRIYNKHKHLVILAREKKSYNFMNDNFFNATIYLTPDIVMTLNKTTDKPRKGALLLFRQDVEKTLDEQKFEQIKNIVSKKYSSYNISDMNVGETILNNVAGKYRAFLLDEKFNEFQTSEVVITDRLHGMIFAAITQTPCVVFGSLTHKIVESYAWLQNLEYIQFCKDINDLETKINKVSKAGNTKYDNTFAIDYIVPILRKEIENN